MNLIFVDVEADGPCPGLYSIVSIGAVKLSGTTFSGMIAPITNEFVPEALAISGYSREEHMKFDLPGSVMKTFATWLGPNPKFISDNPAFDWQFINYYFHRYYGLNPFGFSARRIGDFYAGLTGNFHNHNNWKKLRKTKHDHNPVNDAKGNLEAFQSICTQFKLTI